jgi:hypothetical protein
LLIWNKSCKITIGEIPYKMDSNKKEILESLEKHKGIVTTACASIGLARSTYYDWVSSDPDFSAAVDEIRETAIDFVESKLMEKIEGITMLDKEMDSETVTYRLPPSDTAIIFFLKTRGKKRGYIERTEVTGKDGADLNQVTIFQLPDNGRNSD